MAGAAGSVGLGGGHNFSKHRNSGNFISHFLYHSITKSEIATIVRSSSHERKHGIHILTRALHWRHTPPPPLPLGGIQFALDKFRKCEKSSLIPL